MQKSEKSIREILVHGAIRVEKARDILLWSLLSIGGKRKGKAIRKCNFLILNDPRYLKAGKIAIHSFLARNRDYLAIVHTDVTLYDSVVGLVEKSLFKDRIEIVLSTSDTHWTEQKFRLLMSMQGLSDLYLDVDTRCNKKVKTDEHVTCFVDEGNLLKQEPYSSILGIFPNESFPQRSRMLNTTFFTWNGHTLMDDSQVLELFYKIFRSATAYSKERLAEQITVSILVANNFPNYGALKKIDTSFDRGIIESSYLGATGRFIYRR